MGLTCPREEGDRPERFCIGSDLTHSLAGAGRWKSLSGRISWILGRVFPLDGITVYITKRGSAIRGWDLVAMSYFDCAVGGRLFIPEVHIDRRLLMGFIVLIESLETGSSLFSLSI
jgi:hypothetical protein